MAGASAVSPLVCAFQRGARAWRMGHRPPLCRRHFNRPHLQYSTCCRQRGSPGAHTPPEGLGGRTGTGRWASPPSHEGEALGGALSVGWPGLCEADWQMVPTKQLRHQNGCPEPGRPVLLGEVGEKRPHGHPSRLWQGTEGPAETPGFCLAKQLLLDVAFALPSRQDVVSSRSHRDGGVHRPAAKIISSGMDAAAMQKQEVGFCAHKRGRVGWWLLLPTPPPKLSRSGSHTERLGDPHRGCHVDCESYTPKLVKTGGS